MSRKRSLEIRMDICEIDWSGPVVGTVPIATKPSSTALISRLVESPKAFASLRIGLLRLADGGVNRIRSGRRGRVLLFTCKEQLR